MKPPQKTKHLTFVLVLFAIHALGQSSTCCSYQFATVDWGNISFQDCDGNDINYGIGGASGYNDFHFDAFQINSYTGGIFLLNLGCITPLNSEILSFEKENNQLYWTTDSIGDHQHEFTIDCTNNSKEIYTATSQSGITSHLKPIPQHLEDTYFRLFYEGENGLFYNLNRFEVEVYSMLGVPLGTFAPNEQLLLPTNTLLFVKNEQNNFQIFTHE